MEGAALDAQLQDHLQLVKRGSAIDASLWRRGETTRCWHAALLADVTVPQAPACGAAA